MTIDIDGLTEAELVDLNHRVVERLRFLQHMRAHASMLEFRIGERVSFRPDVRPPVEGHAGALQPQIRHRGHRRRPALDGLARAAVQGHRTERGGTPALPEAPGWLERGPAQVGMMGELADLGASDPAHAEGDTEDGPTA